MPYATVSDVERMVGDLVHGRRFLDTNQTSKTLATSPSRTEVESALARAEGTLNAILEANEYVVPVTSTDSYAHDWLKEVNAALVAARLLNALPIREQDNFSDSSADPLTKRTQTYENQVANWQRAVENGRFPATRSATSSTVYAVTPTRARTITRDLGA